MVARRGIPLFRAVWPAVLAALAAGACASHPARPWEYRPPALADTVPIREPAQRRTSLAYDQIYGAMSGMERAVSLNRHLAGVPPALNADPFDGVVNSAWFTNRNQVRPLTPEAIIRGPQTSAGPDQSGPVVIKSVKAEGITPGFNIQDAAGIRYILKFDPPENPELASGAEVIATNLFWASGYNVPENYVFYLDPSKLVFDDDVELDVEENGQIVHYQVGASDPRHELTMEVFRRAILDRYPRRADGTIRAMASRFLQGVPKGPFAWEGMRSDDPNDVVPHEHMREIRGLYVIAAWLNHVDTKQGNTLDMFIESDRSPQGEDAPKIGYLRHNLIDFGSTLGSGAAHPHDPRHGSEYDFDAGAVMLRLFTLGLYHRPWQDMPREPAVNPSAGYYSVENFDPGDWRSNIVNPAFLNRQPRDGYWGAKIVMSFTTEQLEAAVRAGQYSDPAAAAYVLKGLRDRRDATGRYWFARVSPLDRPRIEGDAVTFDDLWQRYFGGGTGYRWMLTWKAPDVETGGVVSAPRIPLPEPPAALPATLDPEEAHARLKVWKVFDDGDEAPRPAEFWLAWDPVGRSWRVAGARY